MDTRAKFSQAEASCAEKGARLAQITSNDENAFVLKRSGGNADNQWIGYNDIQSHGTWVWSGAAMQSGYTKWDWHYPIGNNGDCVVMRTSGRWANQNCSRTHPYVCQKGNVKFSFTYALKRCFPGLKGAVSRYSVIFCAFFAWAKNGDCPRNCRGHQTLTAQSAARTASLPKLSWPNVVFLEHMLFSAALPRGRHYFSPHKMAAQNHRLSWHCRFKISPKHVIFNRWSKPNCIEEHRLIDNGKVLLSSLSVSAQLNGFSCRCMPPPPPQ